MLMVAASPSRPSMRFNALVKPDTAKIVKGIANQPNETGMPKKLPTSSMIRPSKERNIVAMMSTMNLVLGEVS